ncbi:MAG TPA: hypothetical protein VKV25_09785, partial [Acidimicrobiales bacterium]|nr:hypothetical protein [Acidimicrobiales bacterium]
MSIPGPAAFGRGVVVAGAAAVPPPWSGVPEVVVDDEVLVRPDAVVGVLHAAWAARRPVAVRLLADPGPFRAPRSV